MNKKTCFITMILILITLSCAKAHWYKPGATQQDFQKDDYECTYQSEMYGMAGTPSDTARSMGTAAGRGIAAGIMAADNYHKCMQARGWQKRRD